MTKLLSDEKIFNTILQFPKTRSLVPQKEVQEFARAIEAAVLEAQPTDQRLLNLLCRIHRDGGHYLAEHGLDKAVEDADIRVAEQNAALDAQAKQEPVAWMYYPKGVGEKYVTYTNPASLDLGKQGDQIAFIQPLYAAPVVQPDMVLVPREPEGDPLNDAAWKFLESLPDGAKINGHAWNNIKPAVRESIKTWIAAAEGRE